MTILSFLYNLILEAIFPLSEVERELLTISVNNIWEMLPRAPGSSIREACGIFAYKNARVSSLVWSLKYKKSKHSAMLGGAVLYEMLRDFGRVAYPVIVVSMPVSKQRRRERGFNQCELLLNEIERLGEVGSQNVNMGANMSRKIFTSRKLLLRPHHTARQTLKDRSGRIESAKDLFKIDQRILGKLLPQINLGEKYLVIVIDDVITTGSTMKEAIGVLRAAGLKNTYGLALAH